MPSVESMELVPPLGAAVSKPGIKIHSRVTSRGPDRSGWKQPNLGACSGLVFLSIKYGTLIHPKPKLVVAADNPNRQRGEL